jgi:DNA mismatch endonuclease Vsr
LGRQALSKRWQVDKDVRTLPGQPNVVVPCLSLVIFADRCFYHGCPEHGHVPKSNVDYWLPKLVRNLRRDRANRRALRKVGFAVWSFWEHGLKGTTPRSPMEARSSTSTTTLPSILNYPGGNVILHTAARVEIVHLGKARRHKNVRHLGQPDKRCPIVGLQNIPEVFRGNRPLRKSRRSCLGRPKRLIQIGDDVVHIFDTHR